MTSGVTEAGVLNGARVLVIGGSSGMGFATASAAAAAGAEVVVASRSAARVADAVARLGGTARGEQVDVGEEASVAALLERVGALDHLVVSTAQLATGPLAELDLAAAQQMMTSKFWGPLLAAKHAAPRLRPGGSITFFGGLVAWRTLPGGSVVTAVNAATETLAQALAIELAPIRVNAIAPGVVETELWDGMDPDERAPFFEQMRTAIPAGRVGTPQDAADAILLLLRNPYVSGEVLHLDGGHRL